LIFHGGLFSDDRGVIRFCNEFQFEGIKRFYTIKHLSVEVIRAWQGHKLETKYFYVTKGSFLINWINIDNWEHPSKDLKINTHTLTDTHSEILIIHPGHINGFKALEPDSTLIVYSDMLLEDSKKDDYRFPVEMWLFDDRQS
jgi:dTDP-4-dehydrorhamnose 3,5-epimerase-like enzyme